MEDWHTQQHMSPDSLFIGFCYACSHGDERLAKVLVKLHPDIINMQYERDGSGKTGLMASLFQYELGEDDCPKSASLSRWLPPTRALAT